MYSAPWEFYKTFVILSQDKLNSRVTMIKGSSKFFSFLRWVLGPSIPAFHNPSTLSILPEREHSIWERQFVVLNVQLDIF